MLALRELATRHGGHGPAVQAYGLSLLRMGKTGGAVEALQRAAALQADVPAVHANLAAAYLAANQPDAAAASARLALGINPGHAAAWENLAVALGGEPRTVKAAPARLTVRRSSR